MSGSLTTVRVMGVCISIPVTKCDVSVVHWNLARFVHPHSATLSILHAHVSRAVERSFYPILDCKPVLELSINALEVVRFSFAHWRSRRRTHAPTADRYPPKMGVTWIFWIWLILIVDVVWRLLIMFKRLNAQFPPLGGHKWGFHLPSWSISVKNGGDLDFLNLVNFDSRRCLEAVDHV